MDEDLVANFNHVAGITSVIANQLKEVNNLLTDNGYQFQCLKSAC